MTPYEIERLEATFNTCIKQVKELQTELTRAKTCIRSIKGAAFKDELAVDRMQDIYHALSEYYDGGDI